MTTNSVADSGHVEHKVAHHFASAHQEFSSAKLGMWLFLGQELLFFSALFVAYAVYRFLNPEMFLDANTHLSWEMGCLNTIVLIFSSFTMVMAVRSAQISNKKATFWYLLVTLICAGVFMIVKAFEYSAKIEHGYLPSLWFSGEGLYENMHIFFGIYFVMTGLHGLHVLIGMGLLIWLIIKNHKGHFYSGYFTELENVGLYWHLVDLIWIFLFPLLYLIE
ncbi:cytochrome C oxidase subunit III [Candidatus Marinamargulisbacteria bacterium SCGC AG-414-C22]|nr:cytochrome C oxidase subunit III [Candidatus Marinamargulisbacteria bacterium SCGC AG-414-C22]